MLHFPSFVCHFSRILCPLSVPILGTSRAARSYQEWDHGKGHQLGFLSVTPFSDSFQRQRPCYVLDYPFCYNWWNFILCDSWVIILLKIYKLAFLLIKYLCSTRDLGPPHPSFCLHSHRSMETYWAHFLTQAFKTSLRGRPVPSWAVQVLCMGFIGFPHNPRDTAVSLFFSLSFRRLRSTRSQSVKKANTISDVGKARRRSPCHSAFISSHGHSFENHLADSLMEVTKQCRERVSCLFQLTVWLKAKYSWTVLKKVIEQYIVI